MECIQGMQQGTNSRPQLENQARLYRAWLKRPGEDLSDGNNSTTETKSGFLLLVVVVELLRFSRPLWNGRNVLLVGALARASTVSGKGLNRGRWNSSDGLPENIAL